MYKNIFITLFILLITCTTSSPNFKTVVAPGWNLVSIPYDSTYIVSETFTNAISKAYKYNGGYTLYDTIRGGFGYWVKFAIHDTIELSLGQNNLKQVDVVAGWNLIGSVFKSILKTQITTNPVNIISSDLYEYEPGKGYRLAQNLEPGKGYWIKCTEAGKLIFPLSPNLVSPSHGSENQPRAITLKWDQFFDSDLDHLQFSTDSLFSNIIIEDSTLTKTSKTVCGLEYGNNYFWRVRGMLEGYWTDWSSVSVFQTLFPPAPILDEYALYTFRYESGLRIYNPNNFQLLDSLHAYYVSSSFEFSHGDSIWYFVSRTTEEGDSLFAVDAITKEVKLRRQSNSTRWVMDKDKKYLISQYHDSLYFIDRLTFQTIYIHNISLGKNIPSNTKPELYSFINRGVAVYNIDSFQVVRNIPIDDPNTARWWHRDLNISPNGRYLYLTVETGKTRPPDGYEGTFYVIDLATDSLISKHRCGRLAQIGVSPDGNFVYLSDPMPYSDDYFPLWKILRYNVSTREMETYIRWGAFPPGTANAIESKQIIVSPDSKSIFVLLRLDQAKLCTGESFTLVKIDVESRDITNSTYLYGIFGMKFGKYIMP